MLGFTVMRQSEWFKERDPEEWMRIRAQVLKRDNYTCVYYGWQARRFQQVNHIGAEDDHTPDNLMLRSLKAVTKTDRPVELVQASFPGVYYHRL